MSQRQVQCRRLSHLLAEHGGEHEEEDVDESAVEQAGASVGGDDAEVGAGGAIALRGGGGAAAGEERAPVEENEDKVGEDPEKHADEYALQPRHDGALEAALLAVVVHAQNVTVCGGGKGRGAQSGQPRVEVAGRMKAVVIVAAKERGVHVLIEAVPTCREWKR